MKIGVFYFTTTGNTLMLAQQIKKSFSELNSDVDLVAVSGADLNIINPDYDLFCLGCSAQGNEELDDNDFLVFFNHIKPYLINKKVMLFGSYGWGNAEYMSNWQKQLSDMGVIVVEMFAHKETPTQEALDYLNQVCINLNKNFNNLSNTNIIHDLLDLN